MNDNRPFLFLQFDANVSVSRSQYKRMANAVHVYDERSTLVLRTQYDNLSGEKGCLDRGICDEIHANRQTLHAQTYTSHIIPATIIARTAGICKAGQICKSGLQTTTKNTTGSSYVQSFHYLCRKIN